MAVVKGVKYPLQYTSVRKLSFLWLHLSKEGCEAGEQGPQYTVASVDEVEVQQQVGAWGGGREIKEKIPTPN